MLIEVHVLVKYPCPASGEIVVLASINHCGRFILDAHTLSGWLSTLSLPVVSSDKQVSTGVNIVAPFVFSL